MATVSLCISKQAAQHPKAAYGLYKEIYIDIYIGERRGRRVIITVKSAREEKREGWPQIRSSVGINTEAVPPIHSH